MQERARNEMVRGRGITCGCGDCAAAAPGVHGGERPSPPPPRHPSAGGRSADARASLLNSCRTSDRGQSHGVGKRQAKGRLMGQTRHDPVRLGPLGARLVRWSRVDLGRDGYGLNLLENNKLKKKNLHTLFINYFIYRERVLISCAPNPCALVCTVVVRRQNLLLSEAKLKPNGSMNHKG